MRSSQLFFTRLVRSWKYQYHVFKSIADWTVMLYLIIPGVVIFAFIYRSWWHDIPTWIEDIPLILLFFILYFSVWSGNIRTYIEEADKVFLVKKYPLLWKLKKWGYSYSLGFQVLGIGATIFILLPFLRLHYQLGWDEIILFVLYFGSLKAWIMLVKFYFRKIESRFLKIVIGIVLFILFSWFSQFVYLLIEKGNLLLVLIGSTVMMVVSIYLSLKSLRKISSLDIEIDMEQERKTSSIQLIFTAAPEIEKPVVTRRKKPLLFRRSKRIFKKRSPITGCIELFLKIFIRNYSYISSYFVLINVTTAAIVIAPPIWIKATIFLGFLIMMYSWISTVWDKVFHSNPLTRKYTESSFYFSAKRRVITTMYIIAILLLVTFVTVGLMITTKIGFVYGG